MKSVNDVADKRLVGLEFFHSPFKVLVVQLRRHHVIAEILGLLHRKGQ